MTARLNAKLMGFKSTQMFNSSIYGFKFEIDDEVASDLSYELRYIEVILQWWSEARQN